MRDPDLISSYFSDPSSALWHCAPDIPRHSWHSPAIYWYAACLYSWPIL